MAIKHFDVSSYGSYLPLRCQDLGVFDYDDTEWRIVEVFDDSEEAISEWPPYDKRGVLVNVYLHYEGSKDGNEIVIPDGVENYSQMFRDCTSLVNAPSLFENPNIRNYEFMFAGCTSLVNVPNIPKYANWCNGMFIGCKSLVDSPKIPEYAKYCDQMFQGCTSLITAPNIPDGVVFCSWMFRGCTSLINVSSIPDSIRECIGMFQGCTSLKKAPKFNCRPYSNRCSFMFANCTSLIDISEVSGGPFGYIFKGCTSLKK